MSFSFHQNKMLDADLNRANVRQRSQAGRSLSYIESWHAIAEANRIFGFDGWNTETVDIRAVSERERMIKNDKGWGVTYVARVRVSVYAGERGWIAREGVGSGHGIDRDLGQAHESAIKEAESDARKRALMTFGNQFGLALYDKEQRNVSDNPEPSEDAPQTATVKQPMGVVIKDAIPEPKKQEAPTSKAANITNKPAAASVPAAPSRIAAAIPEVAPSPPKHELTWEERERANMSKRDADKLLKALEVIQDAIGISRPEVLKPQYEKWLKDVQKQDKRLVPGDRERINLAIAAFKDAAKAETQPHDPETGELLEAAE